MIITMILAILIPFILILFLYCCLVVASRSDQAMEQYFDREIDIINMNEIINQENFLITYNPKGKYWCYHYVVNGIQLIHTFFDEEDLRYFIKERVQHND